MSLLGRPRNADEQHELSFKELCRSSCKQILLISANALPSIVVVLCFGFGYSKLPWIPSEKPHDGLYFDRDVVFWCDDVVRTFLLAVIFVLTACVLYNIHILKSLLYVAAISIPVSLFWMFWFVVIYYYASPPIFIWFYYIDLLIFMIVLFSVVMITQIKFHEYAHVSIYESVKDYVLPVYIMGLGMTFIDACFFKIYKTLDEHGWYRFFERLVVYPILTDLLLGFGEFFIHHLDHLNIESRAHALYFFQVQFGILGRYMNLTSSSLYDLTIICAVIAVKDVTLHRMGRLQCGFFYFIKKKYMKYMRGRDQRNIEFRRWYFDEEFRRYRACIIKSDLQHEIIATLVTPFLIFFFKNHRKLFRFEDNLFLKDGILQIDIFIYQFLIELAFLLISYACIIVIEGWYNGVDIRHAFENRNILLDISQVIIYLWGMIQMLSAVRVLPNYFQCVNYDICTCDCYLHDSEKMVYGCK